MVVVEELVYGRGIVEPQPIIPRKIDYIRRHSHNQRRAQATPQRSYSLILGDLAKGVEGTIECAALCFFDCAIEMDSPSRRWGAEGGDVWTSGAADD